MREQGQTECQLGNDKSCDHETQCQSYRDSCVWVRPPDRMVFTPAETESAPQRTQFLCCVTMFVHAYLPSLIICTCMYNLILQGKWSV
jgi:hypothetical protein